MKITPECIVCIFNQAHRVTDELGLDAKKSKEVLDLSAKMIPSFSLDLTPPQNATPMYQAIAKYLQVNDLYKDVKNKSIEIAKKFIPKCQEYIDTSESPFLTATKIAVAGNVIDLASQHMFDLESEIDKVMDIDFSVDDTDLLLQKLKNGGKIVYLADNAGENVFDTLYIQNLKRMFDDLDIYYFARSTPIINDITYDDLRDDPINEYATLIDSGVQTPGIVIEDLNEKARDLFDSADCIISKGMGNFECLSEYENYPIYYLLKVKCEVVANELKQNVGNLICKQSI